MKKFNRSLSILTSIVMGLSANEFNFRSFAMNNDISSSSVDHKNVLNEENLEKFKIEVYRTKIKSVLVDRYGLPLNKQGNTIQNLESELVYVPESLYERVKLHPAIDFLDNYNGNKFIFVPKKGVFGRKGFPLHMIVNDEGKVMFFDSATGGIGFTDDKNCLTHGDVVCLFLGNIFGKLTAFDYSSKSFQKANDLFQIYVKFSDKIHKEFNDLINDLDKMSRSITTEMNLINKTDNSDNSMMSSVWALGEGLAIGGVIVVSLEALAPWDDGSSDWQSVSETDFS